MLNFCWVSIFFYILIANTSWTVAQTPVNHIIFWKSVMRTFRCIYANYFNRLRFLADVSTKLKKMHFLGEFNDHNSGKKLDSFENSQNQFSCDSPFGPFWSVKLLNFWEKLPIWAAHHTFLESRHRFFLMVFSDKFLWLFR